MSEQNMTSEIVSLRNENAVLKEELALANQQLEWFRRQIYGNSPSRVNKSLNDVLQPNKKTRYTSMDSSTGIFNVAGFTCHENYNLEFEHFVPSQLHDAISHTGGASHLVSEISHIKNITHLFVRSGVSTGVNMLADGEKALRSALFDQKRV